VPDSQSELPFDNRPTSSSLTGTVDYFTWARARIPRLTKPRSQKDAIRKYKIPVARVGHSLIVNVEQADARLAQIALEQLEEAEARAEAPQEQPQKSVREALENSAHDWAPHWAMRVALWPESAVIERIERADREEAQRRELQLLRGEG
jgi:hypothetical protein